MTQRTLLIAGASALLVAASAAWADPPAAGANAWGGPPASQSTATTATTSAPTSSLNAGRQKLRETGSAGNVPGGGSQGAHFNNGGRSGVRDDTEGSEEEYTEPEKTMGDYVKEGLGRAWAAVESAACDADCQKKKDDDTRTERAVAGVRGEANPMDMGTSGGASTNGNGKTVNLGSRGGNDGGGSDQGGRSGTATANGTGQTLNRGNRGGGDALAQGPAPAEQINGNKLLNGAVDPKRDGPH
jgi:hypothetical protein